MPPSWPCCWGCDCGGGCAADCVVASTKHKALDLAEGGAYQASILLKASPRISSCISPLLACSLPPQVLELLYPWQKEAEPEESHTEPFWVFSQYLARLFGVSLQRETTAEKLQIKVYLAQTAELTAAC